MVYCRKKSKSDFKNMLSVRGGVRGVQKFYSISWRFRSFKKTDKKILKIFSMSQILTKIDRHFWMPYLVTFFTVFTMEDKGKKVFTYCLSFLEEIDMSNWHHSRIKDRSFWLRNKLIMCVANKIGGENLLNLFEASRLCQ